MITRYPAGPDEARGPVRRYAQHTPCAGPAVVYGSETRMLLLDLRPVPCG